MILRDLKRFLLNKGKINKFSEEEILKFLEDFWNRLLMQRDKFDKTELFRLLFYCINPPFNLIQEKDIFLHSYFELINIFKTFLNSQNIEDKKKSLEELVLRFNNII